MDEQLRQEDDPQKLKRLEQRAGLVDTQPLDPHTAKQKIRDYLQNNFPQLRIYTSPIFVTDHINRKVEYSIPIGLPDEDDYKRYNFPLNGFPHSRLTPSALEDILTQLGPRIRADFQEYLG